MTAILFLAGTLMLIVGVGVFISKACDKLLARKRNRDQNKWL